MLDMSWGEVMLIGGVALIVIGPKDLPKALRTVGQVTGKLRRMAGEFRMQFDEAIREAELDEVRKEVDGLRRNVATATTGGFNPVQTIRNELKGAIDGRSEPRETPPAQETPASSAHAPHEASAISGAPALSSVPTPAAPPRSRSLAEAMAGLRAAEASAGGRYDVPKPPALEPIDDAFAWPPAEASSSNKPGA